MSSLVTLVRSFPSSAWECFPEAPLRESHAGSAKQSLEHRRAQAELGYERRRNYERKKAHARSRISGIPA
jgi:hypothetical protein